MSFAFSGKQRLRWSQDSRVLLVVTLANGRKRMKQDSKESLQTTVQCNSDTCEKEDTDRGQGQGEAGLGREHLYLTCRSENVSTTPSKKAPKQRMPQRSPALRRNGHVLHFHSAWSSLGAAMEEQRQTLQHKSPQAVSNCSLQPHSKLYLEGRLKRCRPLLPLSQKKKQPRYQIGQFSR